ncbi:MAG TPA: hypothetical protein VIG24_12950 [Acidimicrobiia bacterium]
MIGIGITPALSAGLGLLNASAPDDVLFWYQGRPITRELVYVLVRYRIARKAGLAVPPCSSGLAYCART